MTQPRTRSVDAYSDELTATGIAAEERWRLPNWDAEEGVPYYGVSQAITLSSKNLAGWAPHFAADFMAQALKGAAWILGYPALVAKSRGSPDPGTQRVNVPIARWQEPAYALFGQSWMPAFGFAGILALLLRVAARSQMEALATAGLLLALLTYPMIQFSTRHVFYLEFVWVIGLLSLPCALWEWRRLLPVLPRFMLSVVLGVGLLAAVYAGSRVCNRAGSHPSFRTCYGCRASRWPSREPFATMGRCCCESLSRRPRERSSMALQTP